MAAYRTRKARSVEAMENDVKQNESESRDKCETCYISKEAQQIIGLYDRLLVKILGEHWYSYSMDKMTIDREAYQAMMSKIESMKAQIAIWRGTTIGVSILAVVALSIKMIIGVLA